MIFDILYKITFIFKNVNTLYKTQTFVKYL